MLSCQDFPRHPNTYTIYSAFSQGIFPDIPLFFRLFLRKNEKSLIQGKVPIQSHFLTPQIHKQYKNSFR